MQCGRESTGSFVRSVRTSQPVPVTGEDGLRAVEVVRGAYQSVERGAPVSLPLEN